MKNMLSVKNIFKSFKETKVLDNISFNLEKGKTLAIIGPSGCGKSTLLNIISDLDKDYLGSIALFKNP